MARSINHKGFSLIEMLLAMMVFGLFATAVFGVALDTSQRDAKVELENQVLAYAQEGLEAVRNMRDRNYLLVTNGDHGLKLENDVWSFIAAPETIDAFYERTITVDDVYRDGTGAIAAVGTFDPDTRKITSTVNWDYNGIFSRSTSLVMYLSNWKGSDHISTTCTEFNVGTYTDTEAIETSAPPADNCAVKLNVIESASEGFTSSDLGDHGNDVVVDGDYAYVANNKTQTGLTIVNVANRSAPVITKNIDIGAKGRHVVKDGNYAFVGVEKSSKGLAIVDVSVPGTAFVTSTLNVGDYGNDLRVSGNYLYMGVHQETNSFKVINIANKSAPSVAGQLNYNDIVQAIELHNNYAYLGLSDDSQSFKVVDITNPAAPVKVTSLDVDEEVNAIAISGYYAFVGIENSSNSLKVVDISNPAAPVVVASLNVGGEIQDLSIFGDYLYAAIDEHDAALGAINILNPLAPYLAYNKDLAAKASGIDSDASSIFITIDVNNKGLLITGTTLIETLANGTFISNKIDTGSTSTRYNYITWDQVTTPGGAITMQLRTASSLAGLDTAVWAGSDGTNSTYYENPRTAIQLAPGSTGPRYFQMKAFISSNGVNSPLLESIKVNYTP